LFVIARNSSFSYKGQSPDIRRVGKRRCRRRVGRAALSARSAAARREAGLFVVDCRTGNALHARTRPAFSGTMFEASKLSLTRWFPAMQLLTQSKNNVSALELMRQLGMCYRSAWLLKHKIMQGMALREETRELGGRVEIDDAYLGGTSPHRPRSSATGFGALAPPPSSAPSMSAWSPATARPA
jgi:hypothetical protein